MGRVNLANLIHDIRFPFFLGRLNGGVSRLRGGAPDRRRYEVGAASLRTSGQERDKTGENLLQGLDEGLALGDQVVVVVQGHMVLQELAGLFPKQPSSSWAQGRYSFTVAAP
jgi:hypothetical protein